MTILRAAEHRALKGLELSGQIADLGGDARSEYRTLFKGSYTLTTVNISADTKPDVLADLERPLPLESASFSGVLLINVLEHVFEFQALLGETARILNGGGKVIIVVPYLFPYHASPDDFHRFSRTALMRHLATAGFEDISIKPLGAGVFSARYLMIERLLPGALQRLLGLVFHPLARLGDSLFTGLARMLGKKYDPADYALGFLATARKA